jgi:hypothetical protein
MRIETRERRLRIGDECDEQEQRTREKDRDSTDFTSVVSD